MNNVVQSSGFISDPLKVYDARWEVGEYDAAAVRRLFEATFAYGRLLGADTVTLARDGRLGAEAVLNTAVETATDMGFRTFVTPGPISTPQSYFTSMYLSRDYPNILGLTITASHNPANYVGVKFTVPGVRAIGLDCGPLGGLSKIRELYHGSEKFASTGPGRMEIVNLTSEYIDFSMQQARVGDGDLGDLCVVVDGLNGSAGPEIYSVLNRAGVQVVPLRLIPDGNFPAGSPNPTSRGKMDEAIRLANESGATVAVGLDGDGDRIVFADRLGVLSAGFAAIPILRACLGEAAGEHPAVLYDPKVNPLALAEWAALKARPVLFRNGHSQIKDYMLRIGAIAAAEESGHYYHRLTLGGLTTAAENSMLTILLLLSAIRRRPGLIEDLRTLQDHIHTTGEFNYRFADDPTRDQALATVVKHFLGDGAETVTATRDGIDLQGTVLRKGITTSGETMTLRPEWYGGYLRIATNEKHVVRAYFSAGDAGQLAQIETDARRIMAEQFDGVVVE